MRTNLINNGSFVLRVIVLMVVFCLISCGTRKIETNKTSHEVNTDTLIIRDTVTVVKTDSTYKKRYEALQEQISTQSDSIIVMTFPNKIITKTYGRKSETKRQKKTIDSLIRINSMQKDRIHTLENREFYKVYSREHTKEKKTSFNIWKWIALVFIGISLVLYMILRRKYISL